MEELSDTERLIISYIKSHSPEECMLDKITRGTSRSRATVLKYLGILHAKGILDYYFVGRSKLWTLKQEPEKEAVIKPESIKPEIQPDISDLASRVSKLHTLMSKELSLKRSIDSPDTIVFTINTNMDIIATNDTFNTFFVGKRNLNEITMPEQMVMVEEALQSLNSNKTVTIEMDLMEKSGVYRPYQLSMQSIVDNENITGTAIIGKDLSQFRRTKRELETLLSITQAAGSAQNQNQLMEEVINGINNIIPFKYCAVLLKDNKRLHSAYQTPAIIIGDEIPPYIKGFTEKSMNSLETISAREGDYYLETIKSELEDTSLAMMLSVPIIDEEAAIGAILLLTSLTSVSSVNIENVEMAADELAGYLKMQRLSSEKEEFANTLIAMNRISGIISSTKRENEDEMLEKSVTATIDSLSFEMGCIYLSDEEEELSLRVHKNLPESLRKMCITGMFKDLFSKALEKQNLVYITSESEEYDSLDPAIRESGIKTLLIMPIKSDNEIIGLLNMGSRQIKAYNEVSLENISSIGLQLGLALERSRLAIKLKTGNK